MLDVIVDIVTLSSKTTAHDSRHRHQRARGLSAIANPRRNVGTNRPVAAIHAASRLTGRTTARYSSATDGHMRRWSCVVRWHTSWRGTRIRSIACGAQWRQRRRLAESRVLLAKARAVPPAVCRLRFTHRITAK